MGGGGITAEEGRMEKSKRKRRRVENMRRTIMRRRNVRLWSQSERRFGRREDKDRSWEGWIVEWEKGGRGEVGRGTWGKGGAEKGVGEKRGKGEGSRREREKGEGRKGRR